MLGMYYMHDDVLIPSRSPYEYRFRFEAIITLSHVLYPVRLTTAVLYIWGEGYFIYIYVYV